MKSEDLLVERGTSGRWFDGGCGANRGDCDDESDSVGMPKNERSDVIDGWKQSNASAKRLYKVVHDPYQLYASFA
jgi:hypothetical protein